MGKDKFYNNMAQHLFSKLKRTYPNGYDDGVKVTVPLNSVAVVSALIDSKYKGYWGPKGGYNVRGDNWADPWGRYVSMDNIIPHKLYDDVKSFELGYYDRGEVIKRTMEIYNDYLFFLMNANVK